MALDLFKTAQVVAARITLWVGNGQGGGGDRSYDGNDIGINYIGGCSGVGVRGETGSGENGSGDCVMDTNDSGAGGSGSGIAHTRVTGNSGYSGDESGQVLLSLLLLITSLLRQIFILSLLWLLSPLPLM